MGLQHTYMHACRLDTQLQSFYSIWPDKQLYLNSLSAWKESLITQYYPSSLPRCVCCVHYCLDSSGLCVCCCVRYKYSVVAAVSHILTKSLAWGGGGSTPHTFTQLIDFCSALWESNPYMHIHTLLQSAFQTIKVLGTRERALQTQHGHPVYIMSTWVQWRPVLNTISIPFSLKGNQ